MRRFNNMRGKTTIAAIAALFVVAVLWFVLRPSSDVKTIQEGRSAVETGVEVGKVAPDFTASGLDGTLITLSDMRGKPVLLNFWATWCPPCREEMPVIQRYFEEAGSAVHILAVNLTTNESSPKEVEEFLRREGYNFPVALDVDGSAAKLYMIRFIPTSFFIDEDGVIRQIHVGPLSREMVEEVLGEM